MAGSNAFVQNRNMEEVDKDENKKSPLQFSLF